MKNKITTGIWLIFFGIIVLLHNFDVIHFNFYAIWKFWPLLIIALGLNLLLQNRSQGKLILIAFNVIVCLFLTYEGMTSKESMNLTDKFINKNVYRKGIPGKNSIEIPYTVETETEQKLVFNVGAAAVLIDSTATNLLSAKSLNNNLTIIEDISGNNIELSTKNTNKNAKNQKIELQLSTQPIWDLNFNIGASKFDANLQAHKFSNLEINSGAAAVDCKLGYPAIENTTIEINTAASSVSLLIPSDAACQIETTSLFSNNRLEGFEKTEDGYQTKNFNSAKNKFIIEVNGAMNSLKINRY